MKLLAQLEAGKVKTYTVTIPEGLRVGEIVARLACTSSSTRRACERSHAMMDLRINSSCLSSRDGSWVTPTPSALRAGCFLRPTPSRSTRARDLIIQMVGQTRAVLEEPEIAAKAKALGWSQAQVLSMASVVEKETGKASERPIISGVFHNRLRQGIKLETDPTIIYGIVGYDGNIRRKHIRMPHPWNCYVHHGLPATPIAAAGRRH